MLPEAMKSIAEFAECSQFSQIGPSRAEVPGPALPATAAASPPADEAAEPSGIVTKASAPETQPLRNVASAAADLVASLPNQISVAVFDLRRGLTFALDANAQYDLASLAKVPLMLTLLELMDSEDGEVTITVSGVEVTLKLRQRLSQEERERLGVGDTSRIFVLDEENKVAVL